MVLQNIIETCSEKRAKLRRDLLAMKNEKFKQFDTAIKKSVKEITQDKDDQNENQLVTSSKADKENEE